MSGWSMRQYTWPATWVAKNSSLSHTESKEVREVEVKKDKKISPLSREKSPPHKTPPFCYFMDEKRTYAHWHNKAAKRY